MIESLFIAEAPRDRHRCVLSHLYQTATLLQKFDSHPLSPAKHKRNDKK